MFLHLNAEFGETAWERRILVRHGLASKPEARQRLLSFSLRHLPMLSWSLSVSGPACCSRISCIDPWAPSCFRLWEPATSGLSL